LERKYRKNYHGVLYDSFPSLHGVRLGEGLERLKKIRIKRYPPRNFPARSLWEIVAVPPDSENDIEFKMLYKANPKHPAIIEEMTEVVDIEVNDKAFRELMWLFKKYKVPCRPTDEGIEIKHVRTKSKFINDKNR
jgi:hypothetical protein